MAIEHWGKYQLELFPLELEGIRRWAAYLGIYRFDDERQDFVCVMERRRISPERDFPSEAEAIEEARRAGEVWIKTGRLHGNDVPGQDAGGAR